ncbi:MAG: glycosyltransferase family 39 protein, partial [Candidatus Eremiobacteraeota bacterium]|nr:glycosyltransferase family 39 protein [Candidatus Eremiobacteraeota bacterium]
MGRATKATGKFISKIYTWALSPSGQKEEKPLPVDYILLALLSLVFILTQYEWLIRDQTPPFGDALGHFKSALRMLNALEDWNFKEIFASIGIYPPLAYLCAIPFLLIMGKTAWVGALSICAWAPLYVFGCFLLACSLGGRSTAWATTLVSISAPVVLHFCHSFYLEFPVAALLVLATYFLLKSETLNNRKYSILLGITIGLGLLTKINFILYLILLLVVAPEPFVARMKVLPRWVSLLFIMILVLGLSLVFQFIYSPPNLLFRIVQENFLDIWLLFILVAFLVGLWMNKLEKKADRPEYRPFFNLIYSMLVIFAISVPWWIGAMHALGVHLTTMHKSAAQLAQPTIFILFKHLGYIAHTLPLAVIFLVISLSVFIYLCQKDRKYKENTLIIQGMLICVLLVMIGVIVSLRTVGERYIVPVVPFIAILAFLYLGRLRHFLRVAILILIGIFSIWYI